MEQLRELSYDECRRILGEGAVGRVGLCTPSGPRIIPVNYMVVDDAIIFRTTPYGLVGTYGRDAPIAFEVDTINDARQAGYSVMVLGRGEFIEDHRALFAHTDQRGPEPWVSGARPLYLRVAWQQITGRRIGELNPTQGSA